MDFDHPSATGLVFAGLGRHTHSTHYRDSSAFNNHGTLTNMEPATDWVWSDYLQRWVLDFDGTDDRVVISGINETKYDFAGAFSVGLWVRPVACDQYDIAISNCTSQGKGWRLWTRDAASQKWYFEGYDGAVKNTVSTTGIVLNAWQHVMGVYDGTNLAIYVNGKAEGTPTACGATTYGGGGYSSMGQIGAMPGNAGVTSFQRYFIGRVGDPTIHKRDLSPAEIRILANPADPMLGGLILPPKRRLWAVSAAIADIFTAAGAFTIGKAAASASATFSPPVYTASALITVGGVDVSASATFTPPVYSATAALVSGNVDAAASATFETPVYTAQAAITIGGADLAASAEFTAPVYTAEAAVTIGAVIASATAAFATAMFTATAEVETGGVSAEAAATFVAPTYTSTAAITSGSAIAYALASFASPVYTASAAVTIGGVDAQATAVFATSVSIAMAALQTAGVVGVAAATFGVTVYVPIVHYHVLEGPSKILHVLEGPSKKRHVLEGSY
jgi:hypothetical protein